MWDLSKHEQLEMEILSGLNSRKILDRLIFCGGTMLRLCHELDRYSVDLDFWLMDRGDSDAVYEKVKAYLEDAYKLKKAEDKKDILLFEFSAKQYPRNLKIEIRKDRPGTKYEDRIAFSKHSPNQVLLKAATLDEMMRAKVETLLFRAEARDAFDIEFLLRRGIGLKADTKEIKEMEKVVRKFRAKDIKVKLASLLNFKERQYYKTARFRFLLQKLNAGKP